MRNMCDVYRMATNKRATLFINILNIEIILSLQASYKIVLNSCEENCNIRFYNFHNLNFYSEPSIYRASIDCLPCIQLTVCVA